MHRAVAALLAVVGSLVGALPLAFLLNPDPTGMAPFLLTPVIALVAAPLLYREFRDE